jgi:hypothetical protein
MRLSRHFVLLVLLALLTVVVQQGALLHGLSHGLEPRSSQLRDHGGAPDHSVCEECLAYAAVGAALPSAADLPNLAYDPPLPPPPPAAGVATAAPFVYRARAPPPSV